MARSIIISVALLFGLLPLACEDSADITCPDTREKERVFFSFVENDSARVASISEDGTDVDVIIEYGALWSPPRGGLLSYFSWNNVEETGSVYVSNLDGTLTKRISSDDPAEAQSVFPVLSPKKDTVAYFAYPHSLFLSSINGDENILLADDAEWESIAAFSPSGEKIAYYGTGNGLIVINSDGSGREVLSNNAYCYNDGFAHLEWSPYGEWIAYTCFDNGAVDICVTNADGDHWINLTKDVPEDGWPTWSRDGRYLAYSGGLDGDIWVVDLADSSRRNLTKTAGKGEYFTQWSADGTRILCIDLEPHGEGRGVLTIIDVGSKKKVALFENAYVGFWGR
jgi:WD40 repeat protein